MSYQRIDNIDDIVKFLESLILESIDKKASDIHIEPQENDLNVRFRIDGELYKFYEISNEYKENLISRIKILGGLKIDEKRLPQDGKMKHELKKTKEDIDVRISTFPTNNGEKVNLRVLKKDEALMDINSMGFLNYNLQLIKKILNLKEGLVLISGPTGSGKTTTLYAMLNHFDPFEHNISTLEEPIEYTFSGVNQSEVHPEIGYDFSNGLRTLLRQDPDIILVGEIRDRETAQLAIEASLTGHLVLGTIHANSGLGVVERLVNMGIDRYLVASSLKLIISQRLVKKFCSSCSKTQNITEKQKDVFNKDLGEVWENLKDSAKIKKPVGCKKCLNSGYKGRIGIHELVMIDKELSNILMDAQISSYEREKKCEEKGYISLYKDGLIKSLMGYLNFDHILTYK